MGLEDDRFLFWAPPAQPGTVRGVLVSGIPDLDHHIGTQHFMTSGVSAGTYSRGAPLGIWWRGPQHRIKSYAGICYTNIPGHVLLTCVYMCFHQRLEIKIPCWKTHFCQQSVGVVNGNKTWDLPLRLALEKQVARFGGS